jgi:hypothetical protein
MHNSEAEREMHKPYARTTLAGWTAVAVIAAGCSTGEPRACLGSQVVRYDTLGWFYGLPWNNGRFEPARFFGREGDLAVLIDADGQQVRFNAPALKMRASALQKSGYVPNVTCAALAALGE